MEKLGRPDLSGLRAALIISALLAVAAATIAIRGSVRK
jgi:hypothetical protein